jgi:hypothetical protein
MPAQANKLTGVVTLFGGLTAVGLSVYASTNENAITLVPACAPGSSAVDFFVDPCLPCSPGTFSATAGAACETCPVGTTTAAAAATAGVGAVNIINCSVCIDNSACHGHGACSVFFAQQKAVFACSCDAGWFGDNCRWSIAMVVILALFGVVVVFFIRYLIWRWFNSRAEKIRKVWRLEKLLLCLVFP